MNRNFLWALLLISGCTGEPEQDLKAAPRDLLLVTLDTTRFDVLDPGSPTSVAPNFGALASRGLFFTQAYATAPQTLPSHTSMLTGLYPAGHGIHENSRTVPSNADLLQIRLREIGYTTAAFVSAAPLDADFGLSRGFDHYDDRFDTERSAEETVDAALRWLDTANQTPLFLWVHFFDPHFPWIGPEDQSIRERYDGEVRRMDEQLGRLLERVTELRGSELLAIVVADHGESLGDHGELQHGNLLYQPVMRVPLAIVDGERLPERIERPVSTRRVFHTLLEGADQPTEYSLLSDTPEVVLGEAMKPFLQYGWQPQVMAVEGSNKAILSGAVERFDLEADPLETNPLPPADLSRSIREALRTYPLPSPDRAVSSESLSPEQRRQLASLGYVSGMAAPVVRPDAPRPIEMVPLFDELDRSSILFSAGRYEEAVPLFQEIVELDPYNVSARIQLAVALGATGSDRDALEQLRHARALQPDSPDIAHYTGMHHLSYDRPEEAIPDLSRALESQPERRTTLRALASAYEQLGSFEEAVPLRRRLAALSRDSAEEHYLLARALVETQRFDEAIRAYEAGLRIDRAGFHDHLTLGVLYMETGDAAKAREMFAAVSRSSDDYPFALYKLAQLSVLTNDPNAREAIARATENASDETLDLIREDPLLQRDRP